MTYLPPSDSIVSWIVTFYCPLLMAFDIYHTAVNIYSDGFELALSQELSEEFEIDSDVSIRSLSI